MLQGIKRNTLRFTTGQNLAVADSVSVDASGKAQELTHDGRLLDPKMGDIYLHKGLAGRVDAIQIQEHGKPDVRWWKGAGPA